MSELPIESSREKPTVGAVIMRVGPWIAGSTGAAYVLTNAGTDVAGLSKLAEFLKQFGGYGVAAIILVFLAIERQERLATQRAKDAIMVAWPKDMANTVREINIALTAMTTAMQELKHYLELRDRDAGSVRMRQSSQIGPNGIGGD